MEKWRVLAIGVLLGSALALCSCGDKGTNSEQTPQKSWQFEYVGGWGQSVRAAGTGLALSPSESTPIAVVGDYALVGESEPTGSTRQVDTARLYIVDVRSPNSPTTTGSFEYAYADGPWVFTSVLASGSSAYLVLMDTVSYPKHFRMLAIDIGAPTQPTLRGVVTWLGRLQLHDEGTACAPAVLLYDTVVALVAEGATYGTDAVEVYGTGEARGLQLLSTVQMSSLVHHLFGADHYLYCFTGRYGADLTMAVLDVADLHHVQTVSLPQSLTLPWRTFPVRLDDTLLFGRGGEVGRGVVLDLTPATSPEVDSIFCGEAIHFIKTYLADSILYVAGSPGGSGGGLWAFDFRNRPALTAIARVASQSDDYMAAAMTGRQDLLFLWNPGEISIYRLAYR